MERLVRDIDALYWVLLGGDIDAPESSRALAAPDGAGEPLLVTRWRSS